MRPWLRSRLVTRHIVFLGPLFSNISHKAILFATVFSFCHWYRRKIQLPMLAIFLATFAISLLYAMTVFSGRRLMLSVATAPLVCMYWLSWRYCSLKSNTIRLLFAMLLALFVSAFYQTFRHFDVSSEGGRRANFYFRARRYGKGLGRGGLGSIHQQCPALFRSVCGPQFAVDDSSRRPEGARSAPLNSLLFMASYPIPRKLWAGKPDVLGNLIVHDVLHLPYQTNWGIGIVGTSYYEGGTLTPILYAFLAVIGIRLIDDNLQRQPDNVFLLAILWCSAPHIIAWVRGETVQMTIAVIEAVCLRGCWVCCRGFSSAPHGRRRTPAVECRCTASHIRNSVTAEGNSIRPPARPGG